MDSPFFSVIVPSFNRAGIIITALNSVLSQTFKDFEIIVVDDGSTDDTRSIVEGIQDPRVRYSYQNNAGPSAARNTGALLANGKYLIFLDSDDTPEPLWLASIFDKAQQADVVLSGYRFYSEGRVTKVVTDFQNHKFFNGQKGVFLAGTFAVRNTLFKKVGGYDDKLRFSENFELGLRIFHMTEVLKITYAYVYDPIITIHLENTQDRRSKYHRLKVYSILHILRKHRSIFNSNPLHKITHLAILANSLYNIREYHKASKIYCALLREKPSQLKYWLYLILCQIKKRTK